MIRHPFFDLLIHEDNELELLAGASLVQRVTLHEWPLSCVQKLTLADGSCLVYKAAFGPTVEANFYAQASSPILPQSRLVYQQDGYECQLIEWIDTVCLQDLYLPEPNLLEHADEILDAIAAIQGDLPCYLDLRPAHAWQETMEDTLAALLQLHADGKLHEVSLPAVQAIRSWTQAAEVVQAVRDDQGLVHTDLSGDNIFITAQGPRVIDWQRPIYGPRLLDRVMLLESTGINPSRWVSAGILRVQRLLSIHWLTQCASRWFPAGSGTYDRQIARLVEILEAGS